MVILLPMTVQIPLASDMTSMMGVTYVTYVTYVRTYLPRTLHELADTSWLRPSRFRFPSTLSGRCCVSKTTLTDDDVKIVA